MEIKLQKKYTKYILPAGSIAVMALAAGIIFIQLSSTPAVKVVLIANRDLAEGTKVSPTDFHEEKLPIGTAAGNYLSGLPKNQLLVFPVLKGELLSKRALSGGEESLIPIRLNGLRPISKAISVGDHVDVWATQQSHSLTETAPEPVAFDAIVTAIESNTSMAQNTANVEIRIQSEYLETLLNATDSNAQLSLILHETLADF